MEKYYYAGPLRNGLCQNQTCELIFATVKKSPIVLLSLMLIAAEGASAMSLGRHRGAALIGRPLDISIQAVLDSQDDVSSLCLEADVFYADNKLSQSRVQVTADKASTGGQDAVIRVRSSVPVDEPVVTIYLRAGCKQRSEKRFVMLADLASEPASLPALPMPAASTTSATPAAQPSRGNASAVTAPGPASSVTAGSASRDAVSARTSRRSRTRAAEGASQSQTGAVAATQAARPAAAETVAALPVAKAEPAKRGSRRARDAAAAEKGGSRLKLEPLDLTIDRDPQLRASSELLSVPSSSPQERSAAAALWRALTAQPQDILRDAERLQTLESSVRSLQLQGQKNKLAIEDLNGQVKQAQAERYSNPLVYALGLLLVLALAALAYVARRWSQARSGANDDLPWWRKNEPLEKGWANSAPDAGASSLPGDSGPKKPSRKAKPAAGSSLDLDLDLGAVAAAATEVKHLSSLSALDSLPPLSRNDRSDFGMSMSHPARAVKAEELFDVQQQADFFVSLGQHEQAIEVLRSHIGDNVQTSALVYLDLFNLYHQLKRQADYEALREEFNQRFNAKIPAFEFYNDASSGLEAYQTALSRIEALWPSPKVLEVIEESLFRRVDTGAETFNLEAYRELLMLYSVAREIISPEATSAVTKPKFDLPDLPDDYDPKTTKFLSTSIQPLSASVVEDRPPSLHEPFLASVLPPASPRLGLDLDLSDFSGESEKSPPPEVESDSHFFAQFAADVPVEPPASAKATAPSKTSEEIDNLIDFDAFDSSIPDDYKTNPPKG